MLTQEEKIMTGTDRKRLRAMAASLRGSFATVGDPYESYLRALEGRIARSEIMQDASVDDVTVTMNSRVMLRDTDTGICQVMTLVYGPDADPFDEEVSVLTPLGASVLGSRVGDIVEWEHRRGPRRLRVERILFQPEAAGRFDL
jgi:regulator of nucleoside diphosphate kinase